MKNKIVQYNDSLDLDIHIRYIELHYSSRKKTKSIVIYICSTFVMQWDKFIEQQQIIEQNMVLKAQKYLKRICN